MIDVTLYKKMIRKIDETTLCDACDVYRLDCSHTIANMIHEYGIRNTNCRFMAYQHMHELDESVDLSVLADSRGGGSSELLLVETIDSIYTDLFCLSESIERLSEDCDDVNSQIDAEPVFKPTFENYQSE